MGGTRAVVGRIGAVAVVSLSAIVASATSSGAVVGGQAVSAAPPWMAVVLSNAGPMEEGGCSASVIAPRFVLTAAHCVVQNQDEFSLGDKVRPNDSSALAERRTQAFVAPSARRIAVGATNWNSAPQQYGVAAVHVHPSYRAIVSYDKRQGRPVGVKCDWLDRNKSCRTIAGVGGEWDFAVIELEEALPGEFTPVTLADTDDVAGPIVFYGYGTDRDNGRGRAGRLRRTTSGDFQIDGSCRFDASSFPGLDVGPTQSGWMCADTPGSHTASGDSGGPGVKDVAGESVQVAITSFGSSAHQHAGDVGAARSWIAGIAGLASGGRRILIVGTGEGTSIPNLRSALENTEYPVDESVAVPDDLSPYQAVFHVAAYNGLDTSSKDRLAAFVASGGGLYLTGERPCCPAVNATVRDLLGQLIRDPGVVVEDVDANFALAPVPINADVVYGVDDHPNIASSILTDAPGGISGVEAENTLASANGYAIAAVWGAPEVEGGQGRVAVVMDVNWLQHPTEAAPLVENLALFLTER